jgi:hypothetical protein
MSDRVSADDVIVDLATAITEFKRLYGTRLNELAEESSALAVSRAHIRAISCTLHNTAVFESPSRDGAEVVKQAHEVYVAVRELRTQLTTATESLAAMERELDAWREREAACCPEDFGFDEVIAQLRAENERLKAGVVGVVVDDAMVERYENARRDFAAYEDNERLSRILLGCALTSPTLVPLASATSEDGLVDGTMFTERASRAITEGGSVVRLYLSAKTEPARGLTPTTEGK